MEWVVTDSGRLDQFLAQKLEGVSRSRVQRVIAAGGVTVNNGRVTKVSTELRKGDRVTFDDSVLGDTRDTSIVPTDLHLTVLYEDPACFVIDKPAGIPVHPGAGTAGRPTILHGIAYLFAERHIPFSATAVLVHRLDKETTGCLLIAKDPTAHATLQEEFAERAVSKTYLALVAGIPSQREALIDADIGRNSKDRTRMSVFGVGKSREAATFYRTLAKSPDGQASLLQCMPQTGRTHQIRVHLRAILHPILGDPTYGTSASRQISEAKNIRTLSLHAWKLTFVSPKISERVEVIAPIPETFHTNFLSLGIPFPDETR